MTYLPYVEPGLDIILPLSTFIFILNITRDVLDDLLYCGLIGEIFIGILFGMPITGTSWLGMEIQQTVQYLGYLGLICLVFEGGLITDLGLLRKTIWVTLSAAMVGILVPMALSFSIMSMRFTTVGGSGYPTALAAFSAGVSLCSTSLGSTFIILASANLQKSPTGTLIAGAAMLDDIIVLVMVKIVTALGQGQPDPWRIARPAVSSIGLILATFLLAPFLIKPIYKASSFIFARQKTGPENFGEYQETEKGFSRHTGFILSTLMLIILVTITAYVEGSVLLSAFLAGAIIRYIWQDASNPGVDPPTVMFKAYYKPILDHILVPFFFVSPFPHATNTYISTSHLPHLTTPTGLNRVLHPPLRNVLQLHHLERNLLRLPNVSRESISRTRYLYRLLHQKLYAHLQNRPRNRNRNHPPRRNIRPFHPQTHTTPPRSAHRWFNHDRTRRFRIPRCVGSPKLRDFRFKNPIPSPISIPISISPLNPPPQNPLFNIIGESRFPHCECG